MPEKRNENKIMAMLERTGVIRKADSEDGLFDTGSERNGSDIKPLFNVPDDSVKVTPAARQPVPGMPNPVFPSDRPSETKSDLSQTETFVDVEDEEVTIAEAPVYEPDPFEEEPEPISFSPSPPLAPPEEIPRPAPAYSPPAVAERAPQSENYTDRFLNTEELYDALALRSKKTDSIYLIEDYLQTLPGSLPDTQRRDIVNKLISASGFDYDLLMGDGVLRVKMLKEYAERFARHTDDYIAARQTELEELDQQILRIRRLIENRKDLHKKQFFSIEAEAQRLKEILTFISG